MLKRIEEHNAKLPPELQIRVSVEIEKPREELFQLFSYGEVVSALANLACHIQLTRLLKAVREPSGISCQAPNGSSRVIGVRWQSSRFGLCSGQKGEFSVQK